MTGMMQDYLCLDLETTGLNPKTDKIIEIGAVKVRGGEIAGTFSTFVKPGRALEERVKELTGIAEEDLADAPVIAEVLPGFLEFAEGLPLLGHRVLFDFSFMKRAAANEKLVFERSGIDTLKIARKYLPDLPSKKLSDLCAHYEIPIKAHRALEDAKAAHFLYQKLAAQFFGNADAAGGAYKESDFFPEPLIYKVKREGPATKAQKERLQRLIGQYGLTPEYDVEMLTKNEASRLIDRILASQAILQNPEK